jgi:hypothetical protein
MTDMQELVVPRSIPRILDIKWFPFSVADSRRWFVESIAKTVPSLSEKIARHTK